MQKHKKAAAIFLALFFLFTGCAQTGPRQGSNSQPKDKGNPSAESNSGATAEKTDAETMDTGEPESMLLERDVPLPKAIGKKETIVSVLLNGKQGVEIFSRDKGTDIFQYILQNGEWKKQSLQFPSQIRESAGLDRLEMLCGEDGRYYAFYALSDETYHLEVTDDLQTFEEVSPPQWHAKPGTSGYLIPAKVKVAENGILCAILKYEDVCRMYDLKNGGDVLGEFGISAYDSLTVCGSSILCESIGGKGNFIYDIEKQAQTTEIKSVLTGNAIYEMVSSDEMYACNDNGIYTLSSGKWQLLVDSSLNNLSDPSFCWQDIRHVGERLYITYLSKQSMEDGKYKEGSLLKYYEYSTDIPKMDATLTIWGLKANASVKNALAAFRAEHPTVRVVYEIASDTSGVMTENDIIRQFNAKIFAGNGPDLILLDGLHMDTYIERGLLYHMGADLAKTKSELLPGVQTLMGQNPYAIPLKITLPIVVGQKDVLEDSLESFLRKSKGQTAVDMTSEDIFNMCYQFFAEGLALNKSKCTKEELTAFLGLCKQASESWPPNDSPAYPFHYEDGSSWMHLAMGRTDFAFSFAYGLNQFCDMLDTVDQLTPKGFDYHIAGNCFLPQGMLAVSEESPNKELSMEFIQKALSANVQEADLRDGFPVNANALDAWANRHSNMMMAVSDGNGDEFFGTQWPSKEMLQRFLQSVKEADRAVFPERYTQELVKEEAVKVISGDTSADDAADRILNQLELYYDE